MVELRDELLQTNVGKRLSHTFNEGSSSGAVHQTMRDQLIETESQLPILFSFLEQPTTTLAIDTEFVRTRTYHAKLGLVQLFDGQQCLLVDPVGIDMENIWPLLEKHHWVLHAFSEDLEILKRHTGQFGESVFDTQVAASFLGHGISLGYQGLLQDTLDITIDKGESRTDWMARPLTSSQLDYAAKDVIHLLPAYEILKQQLEDKGWLDFAIEESQRLSVLKRGEVDPEQSYLDVKNGWRLNRQQLSVLQVLARWRYHQAIDRDLPINNVVKGDTLWSLARHQPDTRDGMVELGLTPQELRIHGVNLLKLIAQAKLIPSLQWPEKIKRMIDYGAYKATMASFKEAMTRAEAETGIAVEVLASKRQLHELLAWSWELTPEQRETSAKPVLLSGWREAVLAPYLPQL